MDIEGHLRGEGVLEIGATEEIEEGVKKRFFFEGGGLGG